MKTCIVDQSTCHLAAMKSERIVPSRWLTLLQLGVVITCLVQNPSLAVAQYLQPPGITVEGMGEAKTVPDAVEINLRLVARGELTDDAVVKHRDARKRTLETFQALKIDNLKLEEKDLTLRPGNSQEMMQMMMWGGMPASNNKRTQIEIASVLRTRLTNISKVPPEELMSTIGKLIDAAQDSGAGLGASDNDMMMRRWYGYQANSALIKFVVTNLSESRDKAYELAVADARKRAERLARLNGVKLGAVAAVSESDSTSYQQNFYYNRFNNDDSETERNELLTDTLTGGRITIRLQVRFAIDGPVATTAATSGEPNAGAPTSAKGSSP